MGSLQVRIFSPCTIHHRRNDSQGIYPQPYRGFEVPIPPLPEMFRDRPAGGRKFIYTATRQQRVFSNEIAGNIEFATMRRTINVNPHRGMRLNMNGSTIIRAVAGKHHVQDLIRIIRHFVFIENSVVAALEQHDRQKEQYAFHDEKYKGAFKCRLFGRNMQNSAYFFRIFDIALDTPPRKKCKRACFFLSAYSYFGFAEDTPARQCSN